MFWNSLYNLLLLLSNNATYAIFKAFGLGFATYYLSSQFLESMINRTQQHMNQFEYVQLLGLMGVDDAMSIIFGAVLTRLSLNASKVFLIKTGD